jgi:hypothetical protein
MLFGKLPKCFSYVRHIGFDQEALEIHVGI